MYNIAISISTRIGGIIVSGIREFTGATSYRRSIIANRIGKVTTSHRRRIDVNWIR